MTDAALAIRRYRSGDDEAWLRCRVLGFLHTAYFDDVLQAKPHYESQAVELVAERGGDIVGLLDATVDGTDATIETVAVHPDHQHRGIGMALLRELLPRLADSGAQTVDAWTRDDEAANRWYRRNGFRETFQYLHVYADGTDECRALLGPVDGSLAQRAFVHVLDSDREADLRAAFTRVHRCRRFTRTVRDKPALPLSDPEFRRSA